MPSELTTFLVFLILVLGSGILVVYASALMRVRVNEKRSPNDQLPFINVRLQDPVTRWKESIIVFKEYPKAHPGGHWRLVMVLGSVVQLALVVTAAAFVLL